VHLGSAEIKLVPERGIRNYDRPVTRHSTTSYRSVILFPISLAEKEKAM